MCRMMGAVGRMPADEMLRSFVGLAAAGNVLPGGSCGHGDGWGVAAWQGGSLAEFRKSGLSAAGDPRCGEALSAAREKQPDILLAHLRKASVGAVNEANAHPFVVAPIGFCHNGGLKRSEELDTLGLEPTGQTDSERLFLNIVGRLRRGEAETLKDAIRDAVSWVHANLPYSSISFLMSDGASLFAYRDYRAHLMPGETQPPDDWEAYADYYTLHASPLHGVVSSQPLTDRRADWQLMENGELLELRPDGYMGRTMTKMDGRPLGAR